MWKVTGRTPLHCDLARKGILDDITTDIRDGEILQSNFIWVESIVDNTRSDINIEERRLSEDFVGDFLRLAQEVRENPDRLADLRSALEPLFERTYLTQPDNDQLTAWLDAAEVYGLDALTEEACDEDH
jgi:hypothetical protein